MFGDTSTRIVAVDLFVGTCSTASGLMIGYAIGGPGVAQVVAAFAMAALLYAAADRSRAGLWTLVAVGVAVILGIVVGGANDLFSSAMLSSLMIGLGLAVIANRVTFGLVRPIPDHRLAREGGAEPG